jgi:alkanesulfonate monooxygenase SsuD/methylene tetrahydromethanopterin reductase-like flavin-dependent oxidoreductase (luciferase family)
MIHSLPGMEQLLLSETHDTARIIADVRAAMNTERTLAAGGGFGDLRRAGDLKAAKAAIPTDLMAELVVAGDVQAVRRQLARLEKIGITHVFLGRPEAEATAASLRQLMHDLTRHS